jgi:hypothetical protein
MSQRAATIESLPVAFEMVKAMQADGLEWGEDYRPLGRQALAEIIEEQLVEAVDRYLDQLGVEDEPDRRNGYYGGEVIKDRNYEYQYQNERRRSSGIGRPPPCTLFTVRSNCQRPVS